MGETGGEDGQLGEDEEKEKGKKWKEEDSRGGSKTKKKKKKNEMIRCTMVHVLCLCVYPDAEEGRLFVPCLQ